MEVSAWPNSLEHLRLQQACSLFVNHGACSLLRVLRAVREQASYCLGEKTTSRI